MHVAQGGQETDCWVSSWFLACVKIFTNVFSFDKFPNVDKNLGPEMKSTGEAIQFVKDLKETYFRELESQRNMFLSR